MSDTKRVVESLKGIKFSFLGDISSSEKALNRKSCKDPEWHKLRIRVRTEDVLALDFAIDAINKLKEK